MSCSTCTASRARHPHASSHTPFFARVSVPDRSFSAPCGRAALQTFSASSRTRLPASVSRRRSTQLRRTLRAVRLSAGCCSYRFARLLCLSPFPPPSRLLHISCSTCLALLVVLCPGFSFTGFDDSDGGLSSECDSDFGDMDPNGFDKTVVDLDDSADLDSPPAFFRMRSNVPGASPAATAAAAGPGVNAAEARRLRESLRKREVQVAKLQRDLNEARKVRHR